MSTVQITKTHIVCPHCEHVDSSIDHLIAARRECSWGRWYCDECGGGYEGTVSAEGAVTVQKAKCGESFTRGLDLLCIPPQQHPVYFVVLASHPTGRDANGTRYYYEEHSCPTNWLRKILLVCVEGDQDPHGLIKYIETAPYNEKVVDDPNHDWCETFPQIGTLSR